MGTTWLNTAAADAVQIVASDTMARNMKGSEGEATCSSLTMQGRQCRFRLRRNPALKMPKHNMSNGT